MIEIFRQKIIKGEQLTVNAPGTQRRIFTHIDDIVDGLMNCDGDVHFLFFFWLVGFALVVLEFVGFGTKSFCPICNLRGSSM